MQFAGARFARKTRESAVHLLAAVAIVLFSAGASFAQVTTATIFGTITDSTGAIVPNATVAITNTGTNITTKLTTTAAGEYRFELVPVGTYTLTVTEDGFGTVTQSNITLTVNQEQRIDESLKVGGTSQSVTVTTEPPPINLESAVVETTIETSEVDNLPILNRNIYNLLTLVPGVQSNQVGGNTLGFSQEVLQINGGTTSNNNGTVSYYLDGGLNMTAVRNTGNDMPNPEALEEFNVQTSNYNATYGRMSSAVVSALTKTGTNNFHGALYEFNRNTDFDASNPINQGGGVSPFHRNSYGGTLGGPIRKDKTFFFGEFSGTRQIQPYTFTNSSVLPTFSGGTTGTGQAGGDFSAFLPVGATNSSPCGGTATAFVVCSPTTHKPYPNNIITDPLDPTAVNILKYIKGFENATATGTTLPSYVGVEAEPLNTWELLGKIDHQISAKQRIEGSYFYLNGFRQIPAGSPSIPWVAQTQAWTQQVTNLSDTYNLSENKINQAWVTWTRLVGGRKNITNAGVSGRESLSAFGSNYAIQGPPSLSQITVSGYFTLANAIDGPTAGTDFYSFRDLFIWNLGKHSLSLGGEASLNKDQLVTDLDNYGVFGFASSTTARTGNALSDFVLGQVNSTEQDAPVDAIDNSFFYSLFTQDNYRVLPRLTVNLGLRWDLQTAPTDPQNKESTFVAGQQSTVNPNMPLGELVAGDKGVTRGTVATSYTHFSPRLGFAYDPFGNGKTSIRASAGIFWGTVSGNEWNATSNYYPFSLRYTFPAQGTLTNPYTGLVTNPFPYVYTPGKVAPIVAGGSIEGAPLNFKWPRTYQLTASIQQQLTRSSAISLSYVGSLARNLSLSTDINYPIFNTATPTANTTSNVLSRRPIDTNTLGQILSVESNQTSNYNALVVTFSQRTTKDLSFSGFYTFAKNLDSTVLDSSTAPEDYSNLKIDKGPNDYDQRNVFAASVIWQPNYVNRNDNITAALLNGWHVSSVISLHSGEPFNVTTGSDNNNDGNTTDRPVLLGNPYNTGINKSSRSALVKEYFNPSLAVAGTTPTTQTWCGYSTKAPATCAGVGPGGSDGSFERNGLYSPGYRDVDASLFRDFVLHGNIKLQARAEASNVFNLVSIGGASASGTPVLPNATLSSATAGTITSAAPMRQIQLGLRLTF